MERVPIGKNRVVIDIGLGYDASETLQALAQEFIVFAFDPDQVGISRLESTLKRNSTTADKYTKVQFDKPILPQLAQPSTAGHVFLFHAAVGSQNGLASMSGNGNVGSVIGGKGNIHMVTLDTVIPDWAQEIYFLKIDTQGFELNVLNGAIDLLKSARVRYVLFEFSPLLMLKGKTGDPMELLKLLPNMGYTCFDMMGEHLALPRPSSPLSSYYTDLMGWHRYGAGVEHPRSAEGFGPWDDIMCANLAQI